ncbi:MAG: phosphatase PAP2 family protein, partial [Oliverpabstia sp.]|nr:phosphatase PAP2 family protein [Oliverpabstia sp.]
NIFTRIVAWLYRTDTCTNVFPSIHCYNSIGVAIAVLHSQDIAASKHGRLVKFASTILAILICMSTMALKQHSVYDVAGAIILASIVFEFTYGYPLLQRSPQDRHAQREHATERYWR